MGITCGSFFDFIGMIAFRTDERMGFEECATSAWQIRASAFVLCLSSVEFVVGDCSSPIGIRIAIFLVLPLPLRVGNFSAGDVWIVAAISFGIVVVSLSFIWRDRSFRSPSWGTGIVDRCGASVIARPRSG